jgi:hypothetical protein
MKRHGAIGRSFGSKSSKTYVMIGLIAALLVSLGYLFMQKSFREGLISSAPPVAVAAPAAAQAPPAPVYICKDILGKDTGDKTEATCTSTPGQVWSTT